MPCSRPFLLPFSSSFPLDWVCVSIPVLKLSVQLRKTPAVLILPPPPPECWDGLSCATIPGLCSVGRAILGLMQAGQSVYRLGYIPSPELSFISVLTFPP